MTSTARPVYCSECGVALPGLPPVVCAACGEAHGRNAKPCAGALVTREGSLLLVRRVQQPWRGAWDIPGGFCEANEHPRDAAVREVREETGPDVEATEMFGIWMDQYGTPTPGRQPVTTMNVYYLATAPVDADPAPDPAEVAEAGWFGPDELPGDIAFPDHIGPVLQAWRELRVREVRGRSGCDPARNRPRSRPERPRAPG